MSNKLKLNSFQLKFLQAVENSIKLANSEFQKNSEPFDFPCPNNHCSGRNGKRYNALAWNMGKRGYHVYCGICGQSELIDQESFRSLKKIFQSEKSKLKKSLAKPKERKRSDSLEVIEDEYLDCED